MLSRRSFLKATGAALVGAALPVGLTLPRRALQVDPAWPQGVLLGRMCWPWGVSVMSRPNPQGAELRKLYADEVAPIVCEVVGQGMAYHTHVWFELEDGYVYSPYLQPVKNLPQTPLAAIPAEGVWAEISVPYVDGRTLPQPDAPVVYRLYYSAVFKVAEVTKAPDGSPWYRLGMETGITMYAPAETARIIPDDELTPIASNVDPAEKQVVVYTQAQAISAFEGGTEVFRARISSGANYFGEDGQTLLNGTPGGAHPIWSKRI
ncbi:MAG: twin-arginine translocation signal domain-containing protein, partial [Anaerolineales bacterium]